MNDENGQAFDGWEIIHERWVFGFVLLAYVMSNIGMYFVGFFVPRNELVSDPVLKDFLYFSSIVIIVFLNVYFPMVFYLVIVEIRLIDNTYGKEIVCSDIDHIYSEMSRSIERMDHHVAKVSVSEDIYPPIIPSIYRKFSRVIEIAGTDLRIVITGPRDGKGWIFIGPISKGHTQPLTALVEAIDELN